MTERLNDDPWTDEVCQDWLDQALVVTRRMALTTAELNIYFEAHAPAAVLEYLFRAMIDGRSTGGVGLNDYLSNTN